jgi:hypothetical protein
MKGIDLVIVVLVSACLFNAVGWLILTAIMIW